MAHEKERELLERASYLIGNPGANISGSTDCACDEWQRDYKSFLSTLPEEKKEVNCISEAILIIENLMAYGRIYTISNVVYMDGSHGEILDKAEQWLNNVRKNNQIVNNQK